MKNLKTLKIKGSGLDQGLVHYTVHCNIQKSVICDRLTSAEVTQDAVREAAVKQLFSAYRKRLLFIILPHHRSVTFCHERDPDEGLKQKSSTHL